MKKALSIILSAAALLLTMSSVAYAAGQKKVSSQTYEIQVVSTDGTPVGRAQVFSSKNRNSYTVSDAGTISLDLKQGDIVKVKAGGYETATLDLLGARNGVLKVSLIPCEKYEDEAHVVHTADGGAMSELRSVGSFSKVDGAQLEQTPSLYLMDALSGRLNGLFYMRRSTEPAGGSWSGFVRAPYGGTPVVMVDGVVRDLDYIEPETIESVELLKDASLKALFGGENTNGILMVTTKRGKSFENAVRVNVQSGVEMPTALPGFLNSMEYADAYNSALENIGLSPIYDPYMYDGSDPYQYPDVDYYGELLRKHMDITRANAQFTGGSRNTKYFVNLGFQNEKGLEKYTSYPYSDQTITVRGNIDNTAFDFITMKVGVNAALQTKQWYYQGSSDFIASLSNVRPNEFALMYPKELFLSGDVDKNVYGGSISRQRNPLGMLVDYSHVKREFTYVQTDFSFIIDLDEWVKGLSIRPGVTFDIYNYYSSRKNGDYAVYEPTAFDADGYITAYNVYGADSASSSQVEGAVSGQRNWHFRNTVNYDRTFGGKHEVSALLLYFMQQKVFNSEIHSVRRMNVAASANYMYDKRFIADVTFNYVGVPSFAPGKRFSLFPTVGAGWVLSREDFLSGADWVDFLKLRASYGILGSTEYGSNGIVSNYYYKDLWNVGSTYGNFTAFENIATVSQIGNMNITFQKSRELNIGADFDLFDRSLSGSVGFFYNHLTGAIANCADITPGVTGKGAALMYTNAKEYKSSGFEAELTWNKRFGELELALGGNMSYGKSTIVKEIDIDYPDYLAALRKIGVYGDTKGYTVIGTFADQADIDASPVQAFAGKVYPGDLKYKDMNGDNIIDERDRSVIANVQPRLQYGLNISLKYKGINLDILGYGLAGYDTMLDNKYYQIYGSRKYSNVLKTGLPNGNAHPALRADNSTNNFVASDYWVVDGSFFKLRNLELGYTLPSSWTERAGLHAVKVFGRGTNLLTISKIKDLDPEYLDAGVSSYPLFMTLTGGLSFSF